MVIAIEFPVLIRFELAVPLFSRFYLKNRGQRIFTENHQRDIIKNAGGEKN